MKLSKSEIEVLVAGASMRLKWSQTNIKMWRRTIKTRAKRQSQMAAIQKIDTMLPDGELKDDLRRLGLRISEYDNTDAREAIKHNRNTIKRMKRILHKWQS